MFRGQFFSLRFYFFASESPIMLLYWIFNFIKEEMEKKMNYYFWLAQQTILEGFEDLSSIEFYFELLLLIHNDIFINIKK